MKYVINLEELEEKIASIEKEINNIRDFISSMKQLKNELIWEGDSKNVFLKKYDAYINNLDNLLSRLIKISLYFRSYYINYNEEYIILKNRFDELLMKEGE